MLADKVISKDRSGFEVAFTSKTKKKVKMWNVIILRKILIFHNSTSNISNPKDVDIFRISKLKLEVL
jgi:hypothetical protein